MKTLVKIFTWIFIVVMTIVLALRLTGNGYLLKGLWATYLHGETSGTIDDAKYFDKRNVETIDTLGWNWHIHNNYNKTELSGKLKDILKETESIAFLVIKNDSIIDEYYWDGYSDTSHSNLFSATKSITVMLAQCAIQDGLLTGWNQKVSDFFPNLKGSFAKDLEIKHLANMTSGMDWEEHYTSPFSITAKAYYSDDIWDLIKTLPINTKPGTHFEYQSGSTQLLGMVLIKATGRHLSDYASLKLWRPLRAKHNAFWQLDSQNGTEMAYCCFNTNARDFARFGKMMAHHGNFNGVQILDSSFYNLASKPVLAPYYGYGFWITDKYNTKVFYQRGLLGQYVISIPERNLVIVRLGKHQGAKTKDNHTVLFHTIVEEVLERNRSVKN